MDNSAMQHGKFFHKFLCSISTTTIGSEVSSFRMKLSTLLNWYKVVITIYELFWQIIRHKDKLWNQTWGNLSFQTYQSAQLVDSHVDSPTSNANQIFVNYNFSTKTQLKSLKCYSFNKWQHMFSFPKCTLLNSWNE